MSMIKVALSCYCLRELMSVIDEWNERAVILSALNENRLRAGSV